MASTQVSNVIVPEIFTPYAQQITEEKSRLIRAGVLVRDPFLDAELAGGGILFHVPSWKDLANDVENTSTDAISGVSDSTPKNTSALQEIAVRLSRNQSWAAADLTSSLAGSDPMASIGGRVGEYWSRRLQANFIATMQGVFADNDAAPDATEHVAGDLTLNVSGSTFEDQETNWTAENFIDALTLMGDSQDGLGVVMVHSVPYGTMQKNDLIDFVRDSVSNSTIEMFRGRRVIVDDGMPASAGVYESWIFGAGAVRLGMGSPRVPTEVDRRPDAGNGGGEERLFNRVEWAIHPVGHQYVGTPPNGGPAPTNAANMLANAASWKRAFAERKQIKIARLITREFQA